MGRRRVLVGVAATAGALALGGVVLARDEPDGGSSSSTSGSSTPASGDATASIALVGAAYLATEPDVADEAGLRAALPTLDGATADGVVGQMGTIEPTVRDDFTAGRTVSVDGWVLAVSEAQAAALVSLLAA